MKRSVLNLILDSIFAASSASSFALMMTMLKQEGFSARVLWMMLLGGLLLGGCRTYGGYGAEEETLQQIQETNQLFAEELERARADLSLLSEAATGDTTLRTIAEQYRELLLAHEALLTRNQEIENRLEAGSPSYRDLHRVYGAILAEQRLVQKQYRLLIDRLQQPADSAVAASSEIMYTEGRYTFVPVYYHRLQNTAAQLTMREVLREREAGTSGVFEDSPEDTSSAIGG